MPDFESFLVTYNPDGSVKDAVPFIVPEQEKERTLVVRAINEQHARAEALRLFSLAK
jgi:hypothetical protein